MIKYKNEFNISSSILADDDGARTVLGDLLACRYCGQVQQRPNKFCDKCANALPKVTIAQAEAKKGPAKVRCISCGMDGEPGKSCHSCGYFIRTSEWIATGS